MRRSRLAARESVAQPRLLGQLGLAGPAPSTTAAGALEVNASFARPGTGGGEQPLGVGELLLEPGPSRRPRHRHPRRRAARASSRPATTARPAAAAGGPVELLAGQAPRSGRARASRSIAGRRASRARPRSRSGRQSAAATSPGSMLRLRAGVADRRGRARRAPRPRPRVGVALPGRRPARDDQQRRDRRAWGSAAHSASVMKGITGWSRRR